jgi:hypothetical protein
MPHETNFRFSSKGHTAGEILCAAPNVPEESTKFSKLAICTAY